MSGQDLWDALRLRISEWGSAPPRNNAAPPGATRLEARLLELTFRDSDEAVIAVDLRRKIHSASRGACALLGYAAQDLTEKDLGSLFSEPEEIRGLWDAARASTVLKNWEAVWVRKDGGRTRLAATIQFIRDRGAELGACLRLRPAERAFDDDAGHEGLREALMRVERFSSLGRMTAAFAHDMRTPLHLIASTAEFALERLPAKGVDPQLRESLDVIVRHSRHASEAIKGLLDFARVGRCVLAEGALGGAVSGAMRLVEKTCEKQGIRTSLKLGDAPSILLDATHLRAGIYNLLVNSIDAMPKGGTLSVAVEPADDGGAARLTISDSGAGMPPEVLARIARPFFSTKETGLGLGLYLTKRILAEHGAKIDFSSGKGKGTTATLVFPARHRRNA